MNRLLVLVLVAAVALAVVAPAQAKGPQEATIIPPGPSTPIVVSGPSVMALAQESGLYAAVFGQWPNPLVPDRPSGDLGPRYLVIYSVPGSDSVAEIRQDLYPHAERGPVTYVRPGQKFFAGRTRGGWRRSEALHQALVEIGLRPSAPVSQPARPGGGETWQVLALAALVLGIGTATRRRAVRFAARWRPSSRSISATRASSASSART